MDSARKKLGLIVNPIAGLGGRVGLKGSDGAEIQRRAIELGAVPEAPRRAREAIERLRSAAGSFDLVTCPAEMGEASAAACGFAPAVVGSIRPGSTTAEDTRRAAAGMLRMGVDLLLFAGGDGTARDICDAIGVALPALGIPAGVKIHSAVFATSPAAAGELAAAYLLGRAARLREAEVMDLDEEALRAGVLAPRLYGCLRIPYESSLVQGLKVPSAAGEAASLSAVAAAVAERMEEDCLYVLGPGTTTRAVAERLGLRKTLAGVDVVTRREVLAADAGEAEILRLIRGKRVKIVVTPIGGQGCIFGRGNQQISPAVIAAVGRENIIVAATPEKLQALGGRPLWVDTGDPETNRLLAGHVRVVTGHREEAVVRVSG
jgi:predicted polyphosphate/ATP-dependent NAD kinase